MNQSAGNRRSRAAPASGAATAYKQNRAILTESCHTTTPLAQPSGNSIALIGHPNVGKSALFQQLTGRYVAVSNYPGTTIELSHGPILAIPGMTVIDTPGVVTLPSRTEDEQVTARVLLDAPLSAIVQVGDAKNACRTLLLTVQLAEMGVPLVLALNMLDEAATRGIVVDHQKLALLLGMPIIPTIAVHGEGVEHVTAAVQTVQAPDLRLTYADPIEAALGELAPLLPDSPIAPRALGLLWLGGDPAVAEWLQARLDGASLQRLHSRREAAARADAEPLATLIQRTRLRFVEQMLSSTLHERAGHIALAP